MFCWINGLQKIFFYEMDMLHSENSLKARVAAAQEAAKSSSCCESGGYRF